MYLYLINFLNNLQKSKKSLLKMRSVSFCEMLYNGIEFKIGKSNRKGERKRMKQTRKHQFGVYVKMSCSVLLMSGTLIGYGLTKRYSSRFNRNANASLSIPK